MDRKSFVIYTASKEVVDMLNDEQSGVLFKAILEYVTDGVLPEMDGMTKIVFTTIKSYLDKDFEKYETKCNQNRLNGCKGGRPKKNQTVTEENPKKPNGFEEEKKVNEDVKTRQSRFIPPTVEDVQRYCESEGYTVNAQEFVDYYATRGWELSKGRKVKDWKACVRTWESKRKSWDKEKVKGNGVIISEEQRKDYVEFNEIFG